MIHPTNCTIRKLTDDDEMPYALLLTADPSRKMIDGYLDNAEVHVAIVEEHIVGVYILALTGEVAEIKNIAVAEAFQQKGIGQQMLLHAEQFAIATGVKELRIGTANSSIHQLRMYQRCGFEIKEIVKNFFTENYDAPIIEDGITCKHLILMSKMLQ